MGKSFNTRTVTRILERRLNDRGEKKVDEGKAFLNPQDIFKVEPVPYSSMEEIDEELLKQWENSKEGESSGEKPESMR